MCSWELNPQHPPSHRYFPVSHLPFIYLCIIALPFTVRLEYVPCQ